MNILSISTINKNIELALHKDNGNKADFSKYAPNEYLSILIPTIDNFLSKNEIAIDNIDTILINTGPGSYTGIRIGIASIKGLSQGIKANVYGISSLSAYGFYFSRKLKERICVISPSKYDTFLYSICNSEKKIEIIEDTFEILKEKIDKIKKEKKNISIIYLDNHNIELWNDYNVILANDKNSASLLIDFYIENLELFDTNNKMGKLKPIYLHSLQFKPHTPKNLKI